MMKKILIVDDEAPIRDWLKYCIEKNFPGQYGVDCASNGKTALECFLRAGHDLIITDLFMPVVDGIAFIEQVYQQSPDVDVIVLSSHSDFHLARSAFKWHIRDYLLKTEIDEAQLCALVRDCLQSAPASHPEAVLESAALLRRPESELAAALSQLGLSLPLPYYAFVRLVGEPGAVQAVSFRPLYGVSPAFRVEQAGPLLCCRIDAADQTAAERALNNCLQGLAALYPSVRLCSDGVYDRLGQMYDAAVRAVQLENQFFYTDARVLIQPSVQEDVLEKCIGKYREVLAAVQSRNPEAIRTTAGFFFGFLSETRPDDAAYIRQLAQNICEQILCRQYPDEAAARSAVSEMRQDIRQIDSFQQLEDAVVALIGRYSVSFLHSPAPYSKSVRSALEIIHAQYRQLGGVTDIASKVFLHPDYFSRIFKEETGVNYSAYLNNIRLENAARLLESNDMKVYEVAEYVGYSSLSYFSRKFKEKYGINPFSYTKKQEKTT